MSIKEHENQPAECPECKSTAAVDRVISHFKVHSYHQEVIGLSVEAVTGFEHASFDKESLVGTQVALGRAVTGLKRYPENPRKNKRGFWGYRFIEAGWMHWSCAARSGGENRPRLRHRRGAESHVRVRTPARHPTTPD